ncbi:NADPH:quinone reductase [Lacimonas salitolerans]|uniref:NADPH:quinone reductase n=1 Tax=Lacimonas salitolerans TaxID=1323750 RepID=A0ABW4ECJ1_9RHOB
MKAISYTRFGPASEVLELTDLPTPDPAPGEVLVRLTYSGANPSDVKSRAGGRPGVTRLAFDRIVPHSDGAGEVVAVGQGVDPLRVGQPVWIWNGQWRRALGTAAEYIALPAAQAVPRPDWIGAEAGATLGIPGLTAAHAVLGGGDVAGQTLLISGGGGAVGHNAVQLAAWAGARVIATCSPRDTDRVRAAGAAEVLDYRDPDLSGKLLDLTQGRGIDRVIETEFGVNAALLAEVMAENSTIAAYGSALDMKPVLPFGPYLFKAITIDIVLIYLLGDAARVVAIDALHKASAEGALRPAIHATYPLADCVVAHECIEAGGRAGAVLLEM